MCLGVLLIVVLYKAAAMAGASALICAWRPSQHTSECLTAGLELCIDLIGDVVQCTELHKTTAIPERTYVIITDLRLGLADIRCMDRSD